MKWYAGAAALLLLALLLDFSLLAYAMYALLAALLISRALTYWLARNVRATRKVSTSQAQIGDTVTVMITIENTGMLPVPWILIEDLLPVEFMLHTPPRLAVTGKRLMLAMLMPRSTRTMFYQVLCNRRGYYQLGPLLLESGDVFGLHRRFRVAAPPAFVTVLPDSQALAGYDVSSKRPVGEVRMLHRLYEDPTRTAGVRAYVAGDPLNRVHWGATARTGQLHSKVFEPSSIAGATLLLDFHADSFNPSHEPVRSDLAVTAAASIAGALFEMGQQVGLVTNGRDAADRIRTEGWKTDSRTRDLIKQSVELLSDSDRLQPAIVKTRRGAGQLAQILETLARLELTTGLKLPELVLETSSQLVRDATVVAIVPIVTNETAVSLGNLRRRGFAVTALLNIYEEYDYAQAAGLLLAAGIECRHLRDSSSIATVCVDLATR